MSLFFFRRTWEFIKASCVTFAAKCAIIHNTIFLLKRIFIRHTHSCRHFRGCYGHLHRTHVFSLTPFLIGINKYIAIYIHDLWHLLVYFMMMLCLCKWRWNIFCFLPNGPIFNFIRPFFRHIAFIFHLFLFIMLLRTKEWITVEDLCDFLLIARTVFCGGVFKWHSVNLGHVFFDSHDCKLFLNVWKMVKIIVIIIYNFVSTEFCSTTYFKQKLTRP